MSERVCEKGERDDQENKMNYRDLEPQLELKFAVFFSNAFICGDDLPSPAYYNLYIYITKY